MGSTLGYIDEARREVGVTEHPPGSNRTPFGVTYGWNGVYWCVIFLCAMAIRYGLKKDIDYPFTASVFQARSWAKANGKWSSVPHVGDWVVFKYSHIEVVTKVTRTRIKTIGGNTSLIPGVRDRDGGGVWEHWRPRNSSISGYIRIDYGAGHSGGSGGGSAKPIHDKGKGILGMSNRKTVGGDAKDVHLKKGVWKAVPFAPGHYTFAKANGDTIDIDSDWVVSGLARGAKIQVRYFLIEYRNWNKDHRTYRDGSHGEGVGAVQRWVGAEDDGAFGPRTEADVEKFQHKHGLSPDGVVGPKTKEKFSHSRRVRSWGANDVGNHGGHTFQSSRVRVWPAKAGQDRRIRVEALAFQKGISITRQEHRMLKGK